MPAWSFEEGAGKGRRSPAPTSGSGPCDWDDDSGHGGKGGRYPCCLFHPSLVVRQLAHMLSHSVLGIPAAGRWGDLNTYSPGLLRLDCVLSCTLCSSPGLPPAGLCAVSFLCSPGIPAAGSMSGGPRAQVAGAAGRDIRAYQTDWLMGCLRLFSLAFRTLAHVLAHSPCWVCFPLVHRQLDGGGTPEHDSGPGAAGARHPGHPRGSACELTREDYRETRLQPVQELTGGSQHPAGADRKGRVANS